MVIGMPEFNIEHEAVCQGCVARKHKRGPFRSSESQIDDILQFVHSDLSGMFPIKSLGGYFYYVFFLWMTSLAIHGSIS